MTTTAPDEYLQALSLLANNVSSGVYEADNLIARVLRQLAEAVIRA